MKKFETVIYIIFFVSFFYSCTTLKKGFESQRKTSTDEFLVEKKQALVMPPDFEKLPTPETNQQNNDQENTNQIEKFIVKDNTSNTTSKSSDTLKQKTEKFILDKIKN
tara:strand:- start:108 stop:431 length:324 start_codon:yes stop_codon:yes gene_type:complete